MTAAGLDCAAYRIRTVSRLSPAPRQCCERHRVISSGESPCRLRRLGPSGARLEPLSSVSSDTALACVVSRTRLLDEVSHRAESASSPAAEVPSRAASAWCGCS
eukprot:scaffold81781_cov42-Phaeocystis_antarctica.AAC.1